MYLRNRAPTQTQAQAQTKVPDMPKAQGLSWARCRAWLITQPGHVGLVCIPWPARKYVSGATKISKKECYSTLSGCQGWLRRWLYHFLYGGLGLLLGIHLCPKLLECCHLIWLGFVRICHRFNVDLKPFKLDLYVLERLPHKVIINQNITPSRSWHQLGAPLKSWHQLTSTN